MSYVRSGSARRVRTLGRVDILRREDYAALELDPKVELIRSLVPLGLMHVEELLDEAVTALAGARYARKDGSTAGRRHGYNPGTVGLAGQRVPRLRRMAGSEIPLRSYAALHGDRAANDLLLKRVLYGISCRNDEAAAEAIPGAIGLSGSTVSRGFIQASAAKLRELQERDLSKEDVVALVLDGKTFADATMVIALGDHAGREETLPGLRGDGHGEREGADAVPAVIGRAGPRRREGAARGRSHGLPRPRAGATVSVAHARERGELPGDARAGGVAAAPPAGVHPARTTTRPSGHSRRSRGELEERNQSAAGSLAEGLEETVTLHRLGLFGVLGRSLKTTNGLESVNALVEERCATVDHWQNSSPTPTLAGDRAPGYRTTVAEGGGLPPSTQAPRRAKTRAED